MVLWGNKTKMTSCTFTNGALSRPSTGISMEDPKLKLVHGSIAGQQVCPIISKPFTLAKIGGIVVVNASTLDIVLQILSTMLA